MKHFVLYTLLIAWLLGTFSLAAGAEVTIDAQVIAVIDGDTLLLKPLALSRVFKQFYKLRLSDIDAPEIDQPFGVYAKRELEKMVLHHPVRVVTVATDRYGRRVGRVSLGEHHEIDVNAELVQRGAAWASTWHQRQPRLLAAQQEAQHVRRGLWADVNAMPPWIWRKQSSHAINPASASKQPLFPLHD